MASKIGVAMSLWKETVAPQLLELVLDDELLDDELLDDDAPLLVVEPDDDDELDDPTDASVDVPDELDEEAVLPPAPPLPPRPPLLLEEVFDDPVEVASDDPDEAVCPDDVLVDAAPVLLLLPHAASAAETTTLESVTQVDVFMLRKLPSTRPVIDEMARLRRLLGASFFANSLRNVQSGRARRRLVREHARTRTTAT